MCQIMHRLLTKSLFKANISLVFNMKKKKVVRKRSTHNSLVREDCSPAERQSEDRDVEGSF